MRIDNDEGIGRVLLKFIEPLFARGVIVRWQREQQRWAEPRQLAARGNAPGQFVERGDRLGFIGQRDDDEVVRGGIGRLNFAPTPGL